MVDWLGFAGDIATLGAGFLSSHIGSNRAQGIRTGDIAYDQFSKWQDWQYNTAERLAVQQWEEEMWNKQNEYNSPANQLRLAKEAGINPNAIFGNGNPFEPASGLSGSPMSSPGSSFGGSSSGLASSLLMQDANNINAFANARKAIADADISETEAKFSKETYNARVKQVEGIAQKVFKELNMLDLDADIKQKTYDWFARKSDVELQQMSTQLNTMRNEAIASGMQLDTIRLEQGKLVYDIAQSQANIENTIQDTANMAVQSEILQSEAELKEMELKFSSITGVPVGTPEFNVLYTLWSQGKWSDLSDLSLITADDITDVGISRFIRNKGEKGSPNRSLLNRVTSLDEGFLSGDEAESLGKSLLLILGWMLKNSGGFNTK